MGIFDRKPTPGVKVAHLTTDELADLHRHETTIREHVATYAATGLALRAIRERQLYRQRFENFETYCLEKWDMTPQHANRLIAAAEVAANLEPHGFSVPTEKHARSLASFEPADQLAIFAEATDAAGGMPTANQVSQAAEKRRPPKKKKNATPKPIRIKVPGGIVIVTPGRGFVSAEACISEAIEKIRRPAAA